ncbi:MAG TPA: hypothetical protein PLB02_04120 [Thermoanaerobaculia bacterium]|nr:hypothetical protein [Thermoanaerobaculia bacterium]HQR66558.1 hypothetical protein [Thermoanaerobaculia bacterium]
MTGAEALRRLEERGARVILRPDGALDVTAPAGPESEALLDELAAGKPDAVAVLLARSNVRPLPPDRPRKAVPPEASACPACGGPAFWISLALIRVCERCHPPASERLVARREKLSPTLPQEARSSEGQGSGIPPVAQTKLGEPT